MKKNTFLVGAVLAFCLLPLSACKKEAQEPQVTTAETEAVSAAVSTEDPMPDEFPTPEPTPAPFVIDADTKSWLIAIIEGIAESEVTDFATDPTEIIVAEPDSEHDIKTVNAYLMKCANGQGYMITIMPDGAAYVREEDTEPIFRKIEIEADQIYMGECLYMEHHDYENHITLAEEILKALDLGSKRILVMSEEFEVVDHRTVVAFDIQREGRRGSSEGVIFIDEALQYRYHKPKGEDAIYSIFWVGDGELETGDEVILGKKPESRTALTVAETVETEATETDDVNPEATGSESAAPETTGSTAAETTETADADPETTETEDAETESPETEE